MNKKSKTVNKTKPRRTKGRVYQMETPYIAKTITPEMLDAAAASARASQIITEDICSKARRLANEAEETKKKERAERELAFMKRMFETDDLAGAGVVIDKVRDDGTIEYLICGRRWVYGTVLAFNGAVLDGRLYNIDDYLGIPVGQGLGLINDLLSFGSALKKIDEFETKLKKDYPNTLWGRFRAWVHMLHFV